MISTVERPARRKATLESKKLLLLLCPFILYIIAFHYVPLFGWSYSFFKYKAGIPLWDCEFVGLHYFVRAFTSDWQNIRATLTNTLVFSLLSILVMPLPMIFAIFLNEIRNAPFRKLVQTATTLPNFISWIIVYSLVYALFSTESGMVNRLLLQWGWLKKPLDPLSNPDTVYLFQTLLGIWKTLGWSAILYVAAITGLDAELFDAAAVDGAGRFRIIWHITLPGILPTFFVLLFLGISNLLSNGFERYFVFYNPLVAERVNVLDYYIYYVGFRLNEYSYSIALGMWKTALSLLLLTGANVCAKKIRGVGIL